MGHPLIRFELYQMEQMENTACLSLALNGGFAARSFTVGGDPFIGNYAFYNVLFDYYREQQAAKDWLFDVEDASATITIPLQRGGLEEALTHMAGFLAAQDFSEDGFSAAKETAKERFSQQYKSELFRAGLKLRESTSFNAGFLLSDLLADIEQIDFETFVSCAEHLLIPGNMCFCAFGDLGEPDPQALSDALEKAFPTDERTVELRGIAFDPYCRQNCHVMNIGRNRLNLMAEIFSFLESSATCFAKQLVMSFLAERLPDRDAELVVTPLDSAVVFQADALQSYSEYLTIPDAEIFASCKASLLKKYMSFMSKTPERFCAFCAQSMLLDVYLDQFIQFLDGCTFEQFCEICSKADYLVTEAQVVIVKGGRRL